MKVRFHPETAAVAAGVTVKEEIRQEGSGDDAAYATFEPGARYPEEDGMLSVNDLSDMVAVVLEGQISLYTSEGIFDGEETYTAGETARICRGVRYRWRNVGHKPARIVMICRPPFDKNSTRTVKG